MRRLFGRIRGGVHALGHRHRHDAELEDELRAFRDADIDAKIAAGMPRITAERAARANLGSMAAVRDYVGDVGWDTWIDGVRLDIRHAARRLRAAPAFVTAVVLTLGLGVGINTAVFSVADAAMFKPLPYKDPGRLVDFAYVIRRGTAEETRQIGVTWGQLDRWRTQRQIFTGIETFRPPQPAALEGAEASNATQVAKISPGLVGLLGLSPVIGRGFGPDDATSGTRVALLGEIYWKRAFRGDRGVVGRTVTIDDQPYSVVGVLPATLSWWVEGRKVAAWLPLDERDDRRNGPSPFVGTIARLTPRLTLEDARREIHSAAPGITNAAPLAAGNGLGLSLDDVEPIAIDERNDATTRPALVAVLGAAMLVLLIACANVANLLLTRNLSRRRELALRMAIGASRGRVVRQLLTEGGMLAFVGGIAGWLFAITAAAVIPRLLPDDLRLFEANPLALDTRSVLFCMTATVLTGLLCCVAPALRGSQHQALAINDGGPRAGGRPRRTRVMSRVLQSTQVALTFVLVAGTTLLTSSFVQMTHTRLGYDVDQLATLTLTIDPREVRAGSVEAFFDDVLARIRQIPGIRATYGDPPTGSYSGQLVAEGAQDAEVSAGAPGLDVFWIDRDYLTVTGMSLKAGRAFTATDVKGGQDVTLIDERAARQQWPGRDPIGQRIRISPYMPWATVVGVVGPIKTKWFASPGGTIQAYFPLAQAPEMNRGRRSLIVRSTADWRSTVESVRAAIRNVRPALRVSDAAAVSDLYGPAFVTPRFALFLMTLFAALALVTASVGLYGTLNDVVGQRRTEIGIRMALGARASQVCQLMVREALAAVVAGLLVGLAAFLLFSRALASLLFETGPRDPGPLATAIVTLVIVATAAAFVPVRRATRVDPILALRAE